MSTFKNIEKLGLKVCLARPTHGEDQQWIVFANKLESLLQSAQVVRRKKGITLWTENFGVFTFEPDEQALLIGITPLKKKTKAEAALELLEKLAKDHDKLIQPEWHVKEAKRILEMKDEV